MASIEEKYNANIVAKYNFKLGTILDLSGNGWNGTFSGTPLFSQNKFGRSLYFGRNAADRVTMGKIYGTSTPISTLTISAWIKSDEVALTIKRIVTRYASNTAGEFVFDTSTGGILRCIIFNSGASAESFTTTGQVIYPSRLHHTVFTFNAGTVKTYVDGVMVKSGTFTESTIPAKDLTWVIGHHSLGGTTGMKGHINKTTVFNIALTGAEISQYYLEGRLEAGYTSPALTGLNNKYDAYNPAGGDVSGVYITDGKGWNVSVANETTGILSNTAWKINSGTWKITDRGTLDGRKLIKCVTGPGVLQRNIVGVGSWTLRTFETVVGTPTLTQNTDNLQITGATNDEVGEIHLTDY